MTLTQTTASPRTTRRRTNLLAGAVDQIHSGEPVIHWAVLQLLPHTVKERTRVAVFESTVPSRRPRSRENHRIGAKNGKTRRRQALSYNESE